MQTYLTHFTSYNAWHRLNVFFLLRLDLHCICKCTENLECPVAQWQSISFGKNGLDFHVGHSRKNVLQYFFVIFPSLSCIIIIFLLFGWYLYMFFKPLCVFSSPLSYLMLFTFSFEACCTVYYGYSRFACRSKWFTYHYHRESKRRSERYYKKFGLFDFSFLCLQHVELYEHFCIFIHENLLFGM